MSSYINKDVRVLDNDYLARVAPSVFTEVKHEERGDRYAVIPTINIVESLRNEGFFPVFASESRARSDDKKGFTKHMLRFRQSGNPHAVGDVFPEVVMVNSHDGTSSYQLSAGLFRQVCSNGMVVSDGNIDMVRVRHSGNVIDNVIEGTYRIINEAPKALEHMDVMRSVELSTEEQIILARAAATLRWDDGFKVSEPSLLQPRRRDDQGCDLWRTFNVLQEKVIKGGVVVENTETRNRQRAREIKSVGESVKLNKALWTLAEEMARLKAA